MPRPRANKAVTNGNSVSEVSAVEVIEKEKLQKMPAKTARNKKAASAAEEIIELKEASSASSVPKKGGRKNIGEIESPSEEITKKPAGKRGKRTAAAAADIVEEEAFEKPKKETLQKQKGGRGKKASAVKYDEENEDVQNDIPEKESKIVKNVAKGRKRKAATPLPVPEIVEDEEDVADIAPPTPSPPAKEKGRGKAAAAKKSTKVSTPKPKEDKLKLPSAEKLKKVSPKIVKTPTSARKQTSKNAEEKPIVGRGKKRALEVKPVEEEIIDQTEVVDQATPKKKTKKADKSEKSKTVKVNKRKNVEAAEAETEVATVDEEIAINRQTKKKSTKTTEVKARGGRKRGVAAVEEEVEVNEENGEDELDGAKPTKITKKSATTPNPTATKYSKSDFTVSRPIEELDEKEPYNLKISSWNVAGLRSWLKKDGLKFLDYEESDIFCLQEIKCTTDQLPEEAARISGYHPYWLCLPGGYAGVAVYSKIMPIHVEYGIGNKDFDDAGRIITAEYEKFYLVNVYVPNSGRKLVNLDSRMVWEKLFQAHIKRLDALKPVIICGDMNVSHNEIDLANPKTNTRNAGFTREERDKMTELLALGFVDTYRHLYPTRTGAYTFWTYMGNARSRNVGWRLDYFIVSERLVKRVVDNCIRTQCLGSDHCPITLYLKM